MFVLSLLCVKGAICQIHHSGLSPQIGISHIAVVINIIPLCDYLFFNKIKIDFRAIYRFPLIDFFNKFRWQCKPIINTGFDIA
jgi:hypothetical protein